MFVVVLRYLFLTNFVSIFIAVIKKEYSNTQDERNKQAKYAALKGHKFVNYILENLQKILINTTLKEIQIDVSCIFSINLIELLFIKNRLHLTVP